VGQFEGVLLFEAALFLTATASGYAQQTHWLGRSTGTEYVFETRLPPDFAAMVTASGPKYSGFKNHPKFSKPVVAGQTYSLVSTEIGWDKDLIDLGKVAFSDNGTKCVVRCRHQKRGMETARTPSEERNDRERNLEERRRAGPHRA
jgi:hypothetical protein